MPSAHNNIIIFSSNGGIGRLLIEVIKVTGKYFNTYNSHPKTERRNENLNAIVIIRQKRGLHFTFIKANDDLVKSR